MAELHMQNLDLKNRYEVEGELFGKRKWTNGGVQVWKRG
jgi:hypothetical protein